MQDFHLAQINVGRLIAPIGDPRIEEFVAELAPINALADQSAGFVWRLQSAAGDATAIPYNDDPCTIVNMSVWTSAEALRDYTYGSRHIEIFRMRRKWFQKTDQAHYCLWWVQAGHIPNVEEGRERLESYRRNGATAHAFWFGQLFPAPVPTLA